jgi:putative membrane protein
MIIRDKPRFVDLAFATRGSVLPHIWRRILMLMLISAVMVWIDARFGLLQRADGTAFTVFGIALSLFLGFRNNAAYDRWWEARKLWGGLLADLRSLARETEVFVPDPALRHQMLQMALAFLHLHRANLRRLPADPECARRAPDLMAQPHPPCAALDALNALVAQAVRQGGIDGFGARGLTTRLSSISLQQTGCERIAVTPLPYVYSLLIYRTTYVYCLLLPLALIGHAGWLTPLFIGIVAYVFLGLAEVTEEMSHPFGTSLNALPLDAICRAAEISLAPHLGQPAPQPLLPQDFHLS